MSDNIIEIRITGAVDSSLSSAVSQASAITGTLVDQTTATAAAMSGALNAITGDIANLISELRGLSSVAAPAGAGVASGLNSAKESVSALGSAATTSGAKVASGLNTAEDATHSLRFATAGAIEDYFRLGQAAASGNLSSIGSTLLNLGKETGVFDAALEAMGTEAAVATGGVALLAGGLGELVYEEIENERELHNLADGFAASGRAALGSVDGLRSELTYLSQIGNAGHEAALALLEFAAAHPSLDPAILHQADQLSDTLKNIFGKTGPEEVGKLALELSNLTKDGFDKLQHDLLNLPTAQFEKIRSEIGKTGTETKVAEELLKAYANAHGQYYKTYGDRVHDILHNLDQLKSGNFDLGSLIQIPNVKTPQRFDPVQIVQYNSELQKALQHERELEAAQGDAGQAAKNSYEAAYIAAQKSNDSHREEIGLQAALTKAADNYNAAIKKGDTKGPNSGAAIFAQQEKDAQADIDAFHKRGHEKELQDYVASQDAMVAATKSGSQARIGADQREMDTAAQLFGKGSKEYNELLKKQGEDKRAAAEQGARADTQTDKQAKDEALQDLQEQAQAFRTGTQERVDADQKWLDAASAAFGQYSKQAKAAFSAVTRDQQALVHQLRDEDAQASEQLVKDADEAAQEKIRALDQERRYFNLTADAEIASARQIEEERHNNAIEALNDALVAADGEQDIVKRVDKEIEEERRNHAKRLSEITQQGLDEQVADWSRFNQRITSAEDQLVGDIFSANQSLWASLRQVGLSFLQQMISDDLKYWTERELLAIEGVNAENAAEHGGLTDFVNLLLHKAAAVRTDQTVETTTTITGQTVQTAAVAAGAAKREAITAQENSSFIGRMFSQLAQFLGIETQKTATNQVSVTTQTGQVISGQAAQVAAMEAGGAAQIAVTTTTTETGQAITAEADSASIINKAYKAAASAFESVYDALPFPLNVIAAPIAAAAAFAGVAAFDVISAAGGAERIGADGQIVEAHRDESVLPARVSVPLMSFVGDLPEISQLAKQNSLISFAPARTGINPSRILPDLHSIADVGSLLPVASPTASVRAASCVQPPQSDADYVASRVGGWRVSASAPQAPSKSRGGDIHIHAWDASSMNQFFRKPSNRRTMDQISKDRVRAGFLPG